MKKECNVIKDLLPLYIDNLVSEDTKNYVEAHVNECEECSNMIKIMKDINNKKIEEEANEDKIELNHLKKYKRKMTFIKFITCLLATLLILILTIGIIFIYNYKKYNSIVKKIANGANEFMQEKNYSIYKIKCNTLKNEQNTKISYVEEYYFKEGRYKLERKNVLDLQLDLNINNMIDEIRKINPKYIEYGNMKSNEKTIIYPEEKRVVNTSESCEKNDYIKNQIYANVLRETISADEPAWRVNFAINFFNNSIRQDKFLNVDCYVVKQGNNSYYEEIWYNKYNYKPIRVIYSQNNSNVLEETIFIYVNNTVRDDELNINQNIYE